MPTGAWIVAAALGALTVGGAYAGSSGALLAAPTKQPLSVREGSLRSGRVSTGYFVGRSMVGGGLRGGK
ncbi:MAG: hypothetical protein AAFQ82_16630 [Myxococcota bacterium]